MRTDEVLLDAFGRVRDLVARVLRDLAPEALTFRPGGDPDANTIAWLVWHLARVQDDHIAGAAGLEQVWTAQGWSGRFALPFDVAAIGYGQSSEEVAQLDGASAELLAGYHDAVHALTVSFVTGLGADDLDRIVDRSWDPPVTLGVRLVSVLSDTLQHVGQAAYLRGVAERARPD